MGPRGHLRGLLPVARYGFDSAGAPCGNVSGMNAASTAFAARSATIDELDDAAHLAPPGVIVDMRRL